MIIKSVEITSFGKFKNKTIEFSDGLNIISGDNESGKSTIISFIYAMLYGFGDNRGKGLSLREKYTPWSGGECEGKLNLISDDGENITIYRKSGSVKKYDTLRVYNTDTAADLAVSPDEIATVNSDTFLKTICIRQLSSSFEGSSSEIVTRLANISRSGDESTNYEKAMKSLENARREIRPQRGNGGSLAAINTQISVLERKMTQQQEIKNQLDNALAILPGVQSAAEKASAEYEKALTINYDAQTAHLSGRISEKEAFIEQQQKKTSSKKLYIYAAVVFAVLSVAMLIAKLKLWFLPFIATIASFAFSFTQRESNLAQAEQEKLEELKSELSDLENKKLLHERKISSLKNNASASLENLNNLNMRINALKAQIEDDGSDDLSSLYEKRAALEKSFSTLSLVISALESSHTKMQRNFTPAVNKKASEYLEAVTGGKYTKLFCDEEFNLSIETDMPRESGFFSGGTVDQLYLSLRLALIDMLFKDKSTFIILDQPFLQYDKERTKKAVALLENLPKERQILLFTSEEKVFSGNKKIEMLT